MILNNTQLNQIYWYWNFYLSIVFQYPLLTSVVSLHTADITEKCNKKGWLQAVFYLVY